MTKEMMMSRFGPATGGRSRLLGLMFVLAGCVLAVFCSVGSGVATAAPAPGPAWQLISTAQPTNFTPGSNYSTDVTSGQAEFATAVGPRYQIDAVNVGGGSSDGSTITVSDTLPAGVTPDAAGATMQADIASYIGRVLNLPTGPYGIPAQPVPGTCTATGQTVTCTTTATVPAGQEIVVEVPVDVAASVSGSVTNLVSIAGGAAATVNAQETSQVSTTAAGFGLSSFASEVVNADGSIDSQAGSTPFEDVTSLAFNSTLDSDGGVQADGSLKDVTVALPAGFVGSPATMPTCPLAGLQNGSDCAPDTQIGQIDVQLAPAAGGLTFDLPVFNLQTNGNEPARFGFFVLGSPIVMDASVRTGSDYGVDVTLPDITAALPALSETLMLWGDPNDASHNAQRVESDGCHFNLALCVYGQTTASAPVSFLRNGTNCAQPQTVSASVDSWQNPGVDTSLSSTSTDLTGCSVLPFAPSISVQPTTATADAPSGLDVNLQVPQPGNPGAVSSSDLENATVALPQGVTVDPSAASGRTGCTPAQIAMNSPATPTCPDGSKIGTVEITTPLLAGPMDGGIYIAQQDNNPFGSLLAIYATAYEAGTWVKLAGHVVANAVTGQLTASFDNDPQLPFTDFKLDFFGGSQGILATPQQLGTFTTTADLSPWSGGPDATPSDSFQITSGAVSGFAPVLSAGAVNPQADAFSPFVLTLSRTDQDQNLEGLSVSLPDGELAKLAGVGECSDAQLAAAAAATGAAEAASPSCPASSLVGQVTVQAGVGATPFELGGQVYLTARTRTARTVSRSSFRRSPARTTSGRSLSGSSLISTRSPRRSRTCRMRSRRSCKASRSISGRCRSISTVPGSRSTRRAVIRCRSQARSSQPQTQPRA